MKAGFPGAKVVVNEEKPRKGCFEVTWPKLPSPPWHTMLSCVEHSLLLLSFFSVPLALGVLSAKFSVQVTVNGETTLSLLDMPRPFGKLKALDMDEVAADVIKKCA